MNDFKDETIFTVGDLFVNDSIGMHERTNQINQRGYDNESENEGEFLMGNNNIDYSRGLQFNPDGTPIGKSKFISEKVMTPKKEEHSPARYVLYIFFGFEFRILFIGCL